MLALSVPSPLASPPRSSGYENVVARAIENAGIASGAHSASPCAFLPLPPEAAALAESRHPQGSRGGTWVLVAARASGEAGQQVHLHERCLTAVQRVMLALSCDGVDNAWVGEGVPDATAFQAAGADLEGRIPLGLVWCATD